MSNAVRAQGLFVSGALICWASICLVRKALLLLGILDDADLDWMITAGERREIAPDTVVIHEGRPVDELLLVLDGLLTVRTAGTGAADIALLRTGEIVGEMSFVDSRPPSASVCAVAPSVVLAIARPVLERKLANDVAFAARFYRALAVFLSDRLRSTVTMLGYGRPDIAAPPQEDTDGDDDEINPETLDNLALAGARFDWLQRRLKEL